MNPSPTSQTFAPPKREPIRPTVDAEQPHSAATISNPRETVRSQRFDECLKALIGKIPLKRSFELQDLSRKTLRDMVKSSLKGSDLRESVLSGDFSDTDFRFARLEGTDLRAALLTGARFAQQYGRSPLRSAQLPAGPIHAEIHGPNFQEVDLRKFSRIVCNRPGGNFRDATLDNVDLSRCCLRKADLRRQDLRTTKLPTDMRGADLSEADLRGLDMSNIDLEGANLSGAKLQGTTLPPSLNRVNLRRTTTTRITNLNPDFSLSDLSDNDFRGRDLSGWILRGAKLSGCRLNDSERERLYTPELVKGPVKLPADLDGVDLSKNDLTEIDLSRSSLNGAKLAETTVNSSTQLPMSLQNIDFTGAQFIHFELSNHDYSDSDFEGASFIGCQPPQSIIETYEIIEKSDGLIRLGSRITAFPVEDRNKYSPANAAQPQPSQKVTITEGGACAAIHAIVQDSEAIYSFFLPRNGKPPHAHQIFMKRLDEDSVVLLWRDRETESTGAYVELGMLVRKDAMVEIPALRLVVSALPDTNFVNIVTDDISQIIFGYHETSGRGPTIHIERGPNKETYHTASANSLPGLDRARQVAVAEK